MPFRLVVPVVALLAVIAVNPAMAQTPPDAVEPSAQEPPEEAAQNAAQPPDRAPADTPAEKVETGTLIAPKISGSVDVTYNYNTRDPMDGVTLFHAYTSRNDTLLLNAAHLALTGSNDAISYAVEVDVGSDAKVNSADDTGADFSADVQEAYVAYVSSIGLGIKAGKFVTYQGIEVIESGANPTISRGFLFGLAEPFTHVGAVLTYKVNDQIDVAAGVVNGWDVFADNNRGKTAVAKVGYTGDGIVAIASGYAGPEQAGNADNMRLSGDLTGMVKLGTIDLWVQGNAGSEEGVAMDGGTGTWYGAGVQPVWHALEKLAIGGRAEIFRDEDGARTGATQTLYNLTVTPAVTVTTGLVLRGELRVDFSSVDPFMDNEGTLHDNQVLGLTEAIYSF